MNTRILLLAISVAAFSSCSSVYKSGQTPDDVYYSPAPARVQADDRYVDVRQPKAGTNYQSYDQYLDDHRDDRFLRMSVGNPYYMNTYKCTVVLTGVITVFMMDSIMVSAAPGTTILPGTIFIIHMLLAYTWVIAAYYGGGYYGGGYYAGGGGYYGGGIKTTSYAVPSADRVFSM